MSLSDIFSIPFLICLSICILLIGCSSIYFYQKISQQDHKISSMVSLISSLAEESQQNNIRGGFIPSLAGAASSSPPLPPSNNFSLQSNNLIHVSDDEEEDSDSESESDSDSETDADSESSDSDSDDEKSETDVKTITILSEDLAKEDTANIIFEENHENEDNEHEENEDTEENNDEDENSLFEMDELQFEQPESFNDAAGHEDDIKSVHIEQPSVDEITDFSIFKTINISSLDESTTNGENNNGENTNNTKVFETSDYKKMSITKLREIISKQGVSDASKLKKSDILKMLGVE